MTAVTRKNVARAGTGGGIEGLSIDGFEALALASWHETEARASMRGDDPDGSHDRHEVRAAELRRFAMRWHRAAGTRRRNAH